MKIKAKLLTIIAAIICVSMFSWFMVVVYAAETDMTLNGVHPLEDFPESYYDDTLGATVYRIDSSHRVVIRDTVFLSYEHQDYTLRNPDEVSLPGYFPATSPIEYADPITGVTFTFDAPATNYWWSDLAPAELELFHWGTHHQKEKDNMGWMSNNQINYYPTSEITARFSKTPYAPVNTNLYLPDTGYPIYDYDITNVEWCAIFTQDASDEPHYSRLIQMYGHEDGIHFISDTERENQFRKPIMITFSTTIELGYGNVEYSGDAPLYETVVTYTDTP